MGRVQNGVFWRVMYQLPCGGPDEHGAGKGRVPGGLCYHAQRHAMGGIRAAEQILHIQFIAMGEKPLNVAPHALKQFWGARLVDVAPPNHVFTDLVPDNEFIFWRSSCSRAGVAGEYAVFGKGTVAAAQGHEKAKTRLELLADETAKELLAEEEVARTAKKSKAKGKKDAKGKKGTKKKNLKKT